MVWMREQLAGILHTLLDASTIHRAAGAGPNPNVSSWLAGLLDWLDCCVLVMQA